MVLLIPFHLMIIIKSMLYKRLFKIVEVFTMGYIIQTVEFFSEEDMVLLFHLAILDSNVSIRCAFLD